MVQEVAYQTDTHQWPDSYHQPIRPADNFPVPIVLEDPKSSTIEDLLCSVARSPNRLPVHPNRGPTTRSDSRQFSIRFSDGRTTLIADISDDDLSVTDLSRRLFGSSFPTCEKEAPQRVSSEVAEMAQEERKMEEGETSSPANKRQPNPPVGKITAGGIKVAIWANEGPKGGTFHSVSIERAFKRKDGEWDSTTSLRLNDIPKAISALQRAYERLGHTEDEVNVASHLPAGKSPLAAPESTNEVEQPGSSG